MEKTHNYVAIMHVHSQVMEINPETGECMPAPEMKDVLELEGVDSTTIVSIKDESLRGCVDKLKDKLDGLRG